MKTYVKQIDNESLAESKSLIESGELVAFPTETVYGLGANAFDDEAVKKIYLTKGRPSNNPLIAHIHPDYDISSLIDYDPPYAEKLRKAFLPGPLTMVYPSTNKVSPSVSSGLNTLAIRVPAHEGAQAFLRAVNLPIVAPSANLSKHVSPTTADHVLFDFEGKINLILDGGASEGGIESTVLDVTGEIPLILREGLVTREMIASVVGACDKYTMKEGEQAKSPGLMYKHYSPRCTTYLAENIQEAKSIKASCVGAEQRIYFLTGGVNASLLQGENLLYLGLTPEEMASSLYEKLREAERVADVLIALMPEEKDGIMSGVLDRLVRACRS